MSLHDYSRKRNFAQTPEPAPHTTGASDNRFVIQRHHARRLHYDLRLEVGGTLKSWAVPQGPTLDPKIKRLAVHVEDHPLDYADFEGTIPQGNYGAGTVMVWDRGTYELYGEGTAEEQLARGDFKFRLHGEKLLGNFALVRIKKSKKDEWLLLKKADFAAQEGWDAEDHLQPVRRRVTDPSQISGAKLAPMPSQIEPMLATLSDTLPASSNWAYEIKWDGFRGIFFLTDGKLRIVSRNGRDMNPQFPELQSITSSISAQNAILDGEIVCLDSTGRPSFSLMQQRTGFIADTERIHTPVKLLAFDLLYLNGYDLRSATLSDRQNLLREIVRPGEYLGLSESFAGKGEQLLQAARDHGLEGVIAKRLDSRYESGRSRTWLKVKLSAEDEFIICGFTVVKRKPISALVLGFYQNGVLTWAGNVGTGFTDRTLADLYAQLEKLVVKKSPFDEDIPVDHVTWVKPKLVCSVRYTGWGGDNHLRAPVYLGLRPDRDAREIVRDSAAPAAASDKAQGEFLPNKTEVVLEVGGHSLKFTNLNKVFYPDEGYTKRDLVQYYHDVAPLIVPHLAGRPLSLKRYPNGINGEYFFQKDAGRALAPWLTKAKVKESESSPAKPFAICNDEATLLYLANLGCIDQNPWYSRVGSLDYPDFIVLDLDPYYCGFDRVVEAAQIVRRKLADLELEGYPKTTGGDGMHVYIPIKNKYTYEQGRTFAEIVARLAIAGNPELFTTPRSTEKRQKGKVYFDYLQFSRAKTISAPYVLRAHPGAPVATPLRWSELKPSISPSDFNLRNVRSRFDRLGDIFAPTLANSQELEPAMAHLERLVNGGKKK